MPVSTLQADALVVHLFVAANGVRPEADEAYVREVWRRCRTTFELSARLIGTLAVDLPDGALADQRPESQLLAACARPGPAGDPHIEEAFLRRIRDTVCLSVIREPSGAGWADLDDAWDRMLVGLRPTSGVLGSVRILQARLTGPGTPAVDAVLTAAVQARVPPSRAAGYALGIAVPAGFVVWEHEPPEDGVRDRRIVVVAGRDADPDLSAWTWCGVRHGLPRFARYLMHAAAARYQLRIWQQTQRYRDLRVRVDATVDRLLRMLAGRSRGRDLGQAELLDAAQDLVGLQAGEVGLVRITSELREMRQTVDITGHNLLVLSEAPDLGGLFADDREMVTWLGRQLDDDVIYLDAARERADRVGSLVDQLVQRGHQRRQERFNLALTGIISAILMSLTAIQSLAYQVPLEDSIKPPVVAALGALALLASLIVLRLAIPERAWPLGLVWVGVGATAAAAAWIAVAVTELLAGPLLWSWQWSVSAFASGGTAAALITFLVRQRRRRHRL
jgi:hypothetical protein